MCVCVFIYLICQHFAKVPVQGDMSEAQESGNINWSTLSRWKQHQASIHMHHDAPINQHRLLQLKGKPKLLIARCSASFSDPKTSRTFSWYRARNSRCYTVGATSWYGDICWRLLATLLQDAPKRGTLQGVEWPLALLCSQQLLHLLPTGFGFHEKQNLQVSTHIHESCAFMLFFSGRLPVRAHHVV